MTFNNRTLLKSVVLTVAYVISSNLGAAVAEPMLAQPEQNRQSIIEKRAWLYLDNHLQTKLEEVATFANRRGQNIQTMAPYVGSSIGILLGMYAAALASDKDFFLENKFVKKMFIHENPRRGFIAFTSGLAVTGISSVVLTKIMHIFGGWLAKEENRKALVLSEFVKNWETHKAKTPTTLHGLFDGLHERYKTNEALAIVTPRDAVLVVNMVRDTAKAMSVLKA